MKGAAQRLDIDLRAGMDSAWEQGKLKATLREMLAVGAARPTGSPTRQVHALLDGFWWKGILV